MCVQESYNTSLVIQIVSCVPAFMHATDVSDVYTEQNLNEQIIDVYIKYILNVYLEHFLCTQILS